ncbi:hypothetical protein D9M70_621600 [compost metagenome]
MGVHGDGRAARAELLAHDQVGGADHAGGLHLRVGHLVRLHREAQALQQFLGALAMGIAIAGRVVRRHLDQLGQEGFLLRAVLVDELRQRGFDGVHIVSCGHDLFS